VESVLPNAAAVRSYWLRGDQELVLTPPRDGTVELRFVPRRLYGGLVWARLYDNDGKFLRRYLVSEDEPIRFKGVAGRTYGLRVSAGPAFYRFEISGAHWAVNANVSDKGLHLIQAVSPLYFQVPAGLASFRLWLGATPPGETAIGRLKTPSGKEIARFDCSKKAIDEQDIRVPAGEAGWWQLIVEPAPVWVLDDVYVHFAPPLSGDVGVDPKAALAGVSPKPKK
jgi:hypothetical protein